MSDVGLSHWIAVIRNEHRGQTTVISYLCSASDFSFSSGATWVIVHRNGHPRSCGLPNNARRTRIC